MRPELNAWTILAALIVAAIIVIREYRVYRDAFPPNDEDDE